MSLLYPRVSVWQIVTICDKQKLFCVQDLLFQCALRIARRTNGHRDRVSPSDKHVDIVTSGLYVAGVRRCDLSHRLPFHTFIHTVRFSLFISVSMSSPLLPSFSEIHLFLAVRLRPNPARWML